MSQKSNSKVSMNLVLMVIDIAQGMLYLLVTFNFYIVTWIDKLLTIHSVYGITQNLYMNSDRPPEQWWTLVMVLEIRELKKLSRRKLFKEQRERWEGGLTYHKMFPIYVPRIFSQFMYSRNVVFLSKFSLLAPIGVLYRYSLSSNVFVWS